MFLDYDSSDDYLSFVKYWMDTDPKIALLWLEG